MTIEEIKAAVKARGWTQENLAEKLGMSHGTIRKILSGNVPLSESTEKHIALLLEQERVHPCIYTVTLPSVVVHKCLPTFSEMTADEREAALLGIVHDALETLAENGSKRFTPEQLEHMKAAFAKCATGVIRVQVEVEDDARPAKLVPLTPAVEPDRMMPFSIKPAPKVAAPAPGL